MADRLVRRAVVGLSLVWLWPLAALVVGDEADAQRLARGLQPFVECLSGQRGEFVLAAHADLEIDGRPQPVDLRLARFSNGGFDLSAVHPEYSFELRRRADVTALALPHHKVVFLGDGAVDAADHLDPRGIAARLVGLGTAAFRYTPLLSQNDPAGWSAVLTTLLKARFDRDANRWLVGDASVAFAESDAAVTVTVEQTTVRVAVLPTAEATDATAWPGYRRVAVERAELERTLARGTRRALEVLAPSRLLTQPSQQERQTEHGELRWIDGERVAILRGTPEQIGRAHGELLKVESQRCIDSVLYAFGTVQTVVTGRWFRDDLDQAFEQLAAHIPDDHRRETRALAAAIGQDPQLVEALNVFPEMFHCSGFAVCNSATKDGKLYHGRVLDYMTTIGLQDAATTFIVAVDGKLGFANVGYAGFVGSVSGMNEQAISLGEMGGRGEGQWHGVPMATLMRRALEECSTLDQVMELWQTSPRTCEYYYVFADGKTNRAVGVAATPASIEFIAPGQSDPRLGEGIADAVVLSAGSRLETLRQRVQEKHGQIDAETAIWLMSRPVAMESNLHNVLFVPADGVLYVSNAEHQRPAAECPYVRLNLRELLGKPARTTNVSAPAAAPLPYQVARRYDARDTLSVADEMSAQTQRFLARLAWEPEKFAVDVEPAPPGRGDLLVRFPSPLPTGHAANDRVALEWYVAKNQHGQPITAPAVVVVHESGKGMTVGRIFARGLRVQGIHTFLIHLPMYGVRRSEDRRPQADNLLETIRQAVGDVRRARDAVVALPYVDQRHVALQGTSLGGFVAATSGGLDRGFDSVFLVLAGGDLYELLQHGAQDVENVRNELAKAGLTVEMLKPLIDTIEPTHVAHRLPRERTWLYSGIYDDVVPLRNAEALARAAGLDGEHHRQLLANHYSGILFLPGILAHIQHEITSYRRP